MHDQPTVPYGYCHCGCGERTTISPRNDARAGHRKGEPVRFYRGHSHLRPRPNFDNYRLKDGPLDTPCWIWQGYIDSGTGYGKAGRRAMHVEQYKRYVGPVPEGHELDHLCRERRCCNPDHLEPVTHVENIRRGAATRLTVEQVLEIRRLAAHGWTTRRLGKRFGIHGSYAHNIVARKNWRDV